MTMTARPWSTDPENPRVGVKTYLMFRCVEFLLTPDEARALAAELVREAQAVEGTGS